MLWGKPVATVYIRPQRYTLEFVEREDCFTLSFFGEEYRKALAWAMEEGITTAQSSQEFAPDRSCTRAASLPT